jgi:hypothetical protein
MSDEPKQERDEYIRAIALSRARSLARRRMFQRVTEAWRSFWGPVRRWSFWIMLIGTLAVVFVHFALLAWKKSG